MRKNTYHIIFLFLFYGLAACKEEEAFLKEVVVKGRIYDDNRQQPVKNILVIMYDVECKNLKCHYNKILDSTRTNINGYYEMNHKPKNGNGIYVSCTFKDRKYAFPPNKGPDQRVGRRTNIVDYTLRETSVLRTRVIVTKNPFPPLRIMEVMNYYTVRINGVNNDTVIYLRGVPNFNNQIDLDFISPDLTFYRRRIDYIQLGAFADTIDITIKADPNTFPLNR